MRTYVALLRAVNVGGTGKLPMAALKVMCEEAGFESVKTYIASGNVVFAAAGQEDKVKRTLETRLKNYAGTKVEVFVRTAREMMDLVEANPYPDEPGNKVAVMFLDGHPPADLKKRAKGVAGERFKAADREVFIHYPDGLGATKLRLNVGVGTTRNMNTVRTLADMANAFREPTGPESTR
jgi:uncharacterized protein (DUF1697 family)